MSASASTASPLPGIVATAVVTAASELLVRAFPDAHGQPRLPAVVFALLLGAVFVNAFTRTRPALNPGIDVVKKRVLKLAIILYGLGITAGNLRAAGSPVFLLILICLALSLLIAAFVGRLYAASKKSRILLGCGTAICGATAVVTIAPLIDADDDEVAFSVTTIFLFNLVALFLFPWIGHHLGMSDTAFGAWTGTAVNDTSAVVATGRAFSLTAGAFATLVKVVRTLALVPMALLVATTWGKEREGGAARVSIVEVFPWFVLGFALTASLAVSGLAPAAVVSVAKQVASILITAVLAAVGLHLDGKKVLGSGLRPLALGFTIAGAMAVISLWLVGALGVR